MKVSLFEIFLAQIAIYSGLWLMDEYVASYMCIVIPAIAMVLLAVAGLAELFERSKVPKKYFGFMAISVVTPLLVGLSFYILYDGKLEWLEGL